MILGTITVPAGTLRKSYETAAWYRTFEYPAQTAELRRRGQFVDYRLVGKVTFEYLPNMFGGVATGGGTVGESDYEDSHLCSIYDYELAGLVVAQDERINLVDGLTVESRDVDHPISCMGYRYTGENSGQFPSVAACGHDYHVNHRGENVGHTDPRGHWPAHPKSGYVPDEVRTVTHHKITKLAKVDR